MPSQKHFLLLCKYTLFGVISWFLAACSDYNRKEVYVAKGRKVEVVGQNGQFTLLRNGEPYFIKGAGGYQHFDKIRENGGNSVRIWHTEDAARLLDEAHAHGLTVTLGLWMGREVDGFNYYDKELVARQQEEMRQVVLRYKDHPALLMWGIGNELNLDASNTKVWDAVNGIAEMIHQIDPDHPTTTMLVGVRAKLINLILRKCPAIDIISFNAFGPMANIPRKIRESDWKGPYLISEFGARGYWETYTTWWYAPLEQNSSEKAAFIRERYEKVFFTDTGRCLGSYVFYWGQKYEATPTWFSLFSSTGESTETVEVMRTFWKGDSSLNKTPRVTGMLLNGKSAYHNTYLKTQRQYTAQIEVWDPEGDSLRFAWEIQPETVGEHGETTLTEPAAVGGIQQISGNQVQIIAPAQEGPYRLFAYVYDGKGNVATANIPFYVNAAGMYVQAD